MNGFQMVVKFFQDCGLFIYPSLLIMALGVSIAVERFIFLGRARNENRKLWAKVLPMLQNGRFKEVQATFANVITLVGLLGTIIGLIKGFTAVAQVNPAEKAELLSASISIAMNNTAFALMVAIPFLLIHSFLQAKTSEIVDGLEAAKISFLNLVQRIKAESATGQPHLHAANSR